MMLEIREGGGTNMVSCVHIRAVLRDWTGEMARRRMNNIRRLGRSYSEVADTLRYDPLAVGTARVADVRAVMRRWVRPFLVGKRCRCQADPGVGCWRGRQVRPARF